jgi:hypothetical protein
MAWGETISIGWIVLAVVVGLLLLLLFAPIHLKASLEHPLRFGVRLSWLWIPVWSLMPGRRRRKRKRSAGPRRKRRVGMREGRALIAALRTPGVARLLWSTALKVMDSLTLVKGELVVAMGFSSRGATGGLAALLAGIGPRFALGRGKINIELAPDFGGRRLSAEGELTVRTHLFSWLSIGLGLLFSRTARDGWRVWKSELKRRPAAREQA